MRKIIYAIFILTLTSCALDKQHTVGETFSSYNYAGKDPIYFYRGIYDGKKLYQLNPNFQMSTQKEFGVLVDENNKVVMSLSRDDINRLYYEQQQKNISNLSNMSESELLSRKEYLNKKLDEEGRRVWDPRRNTWVDTPRGKELMDESLKVQEQLNKFAVAREKERQDKIKKEARPLTPEEQKKFLEVMNAYTKALIAASGEGNNSSKNSGGWCVRVQPKNNCEVGNIRSAGQGLFKFSTNCVGRYGSSGSSGIGEVNCNNQTQWSSTNYSAQCYKC